MPWGRPAFPCSADMWVSGNVPGTPHPPHAPPLTTPISLHLAALTPQHCPAHTLPAPAPPASAPVGPSVCLAPGAWWVKVLMGPWRSSLSGGRGRVPSPAQQLGREL